MLLPVTLQARRSRPPAESLHDARTFELLSKLRVDNAALFTRRPSLGFLCYRCWRSLALLQFGVTMMRSWAKFTAGIQLIGLLWGLMDQHVPPSVRTKSKATGLVNPQLWTYAYSRQWRKNAGPDLLGKSAGRFGEAVKAPASLPAAEPRLNNSCKLVVYVLLHVFLFCMI